MTDDHKSSLAKQLEERTGFTVMFKHKHPSCDVALVVDWDQRFAAARAVVGDSDRLPIQLEGPRATYAGEVRIAGIGPVVHGEDGWLGYRQAVLMVDFVSLPVVDD